MALTTSYLTSTKNFEGIMKSILGARAPERFTNKFLEDLGYKSSNDRLITGVLKALGVQAVIAKSFARIFFRNAINIGLPAIVCKDLPDDVKTGDSMELHMSDGTATANGKTYTCTKLPEYMQGILNQGGLIASLNKEEK